VQLVPQGLLSKEIMSSLSNAEFADSINTGGGASINFATREPVEGKGFMVGQMPPGGVEDVRPLPAKAEDIADFAEKNSTLAESHPTAAHGAWVDSTDPSKFTQDVSVQVPTPAETSKMGVEQKQIAAYALPGTRVSKNRRMRRAWGGDVLLHTADLGATDVDPQYRPGAQDIPGGKGSFTKNQYANRDWDKTAGTTTNGGTTKPQKVKYEDILRKINEARAMRLRGE